MKKLFVLSLFIVLLTVAAGGASSWTYWTTPAPRTTVTNTSNYWNNVLNNRGTASTPPSTPSTSTTIRNVSTPQAGLTADEQRIINLVNQERRSMGLPALQVDMSLVAIAKKKSHDMAANNYFDHHSPTYGTVYTMLQDAGIRYQRAGENIAMANGVERAHQLFMNSRGHRANIMSSGYTHIGVGIVVWGRSYYVTQTFVMR